MGLVSQGRNCLGDGESLAQEWQMPMWLPCAVRVMGSAGACNCICRLNVSCLGDLMSAERTCRKGLESYLGGGGGGGQKPVCHCHLWKWQKSGCNDVCELNSVYMGLYCESVHCRKHLPPQGGADACVRFTWSVRAAEPAGMCSHDGVYECLV